MRHSLTRLLPALLVPAMACAADWPHLRGPDQASAVVADAGWPEQMSLRATWTAELGIGCTGAVVADGILVSVGNREEQDRLVALDAANGTEKWVVAYPEPLDANFYKGGPNATPTLHSGRVYGISRQGLALCLELATGKEIWRRQIKTEQNLTPPKWGFSGSPLILADRLILNAGDSGLALALENGSTLWSSAGGGAGYSCPTLAPDGSVLIFTAKALMAVKPDDGAVRWQQPWKTDHDVNAAAPLVTPAGILVSSGYKTGTGLIAADGSRRVWFSADLKHQMAGPILLGEHVYGVDGNKSKPGELYCMNPADGSVVWRKAGFGTGSVVAVGSILVALGEDGTLVLAEANPRIYVEKARAKFLEGHCWNNAAVADARIFVKNDDGRLVCVEVGR